MASSEVASQLNDSAQTSSGFPASQQIMSESIRQAIFTHVFVLTVSLAIIGIVANIINIVVYSRMGFSVVTNISFLALASSDLLCSIFMLVMQFGNHPMFSHTFAWELAALSNPAFYFTSAFGSWITTVITAERCCCIVLPMKVKLIFTRVTTSGLILFMLLYQVATVTPHYVVIAEGFAASSSNTQQMSAMMQQMMRMMTGGNQSGGAPPPAMPQQRLYYNRDVGILSLLLSFSIPAAVCFVLVILGTVFLLIGLARSARWRRSTSTSSNSEKVSAKENRLARTVLVVCILYIVCFFPSFAIILIPTLYPPFNRFDPRFGNIVSSFFVFSTFFQAVSSSMNLFIYLVMSTQYRANFLKLFDQKKEHKK